jgi:hypothetical protein
VEPEAIILEANSIIKGRITAMVLLRNRLPDNLPLLVNYRRKHFPLFKVYLNLESGKVSGSESSIEIFPVGKKIIYQYNRHL